MNIYPSAPIQLGIAGGVIEVYVDAACAKLAAIFDLDGNALHELSVPTSGVLPLFQAAEAPVYVLTGDGVVVALYAAALATEGGGGFTPPGPVAEIDWHDPANTGPGFAVLDDYINEGTGALGLFPLPLGSAPSAAQFSIYDENVLPSGAPVGGASHAQVLYLSPTNVASLDWLGLNPGFQLTADGLNFNNPAGTILIAGAAEIAINAGGHVWGFMATEPRLTLPVSNGLYAATDLASLSGMGADGDFALISNESGSGAIYAVHANGAWTADASFPASAGPVLTDTSDGHTYRIVSTAGILSTVMVT